MSESPLSVPLTVIAQLNHRLLPLDRGARYEDPLDGALSAHALGTVTGGGTLLTDAGEVAAVNIDIELRDAVRGVPFLVTALEALGAPKGSELLLQEPTGTREVPFGQAEGVAVYLDGVGLPADVYATSDVNVVVEELNARLGEAGEMQSYWEGPQQTALYFYGADAAEMKRRMAEFLATYPLCAGARVDVIAPRAGAAT